MRHFILMALLAALIAIVFGAIGRDTPRGRLLYGIKVFAEFLGVGLGLAWLLYLIPS